MATSVPSSAGAPRALGFSIIALLTVALGVRTPAHAADPAPKQVRALKITVLSTMLADSVGIGEWGFAALVECDGKKLLFDTGARPRTVLENARELKIDLSDVEDVILSHFHDDHTTGLVTLRRELAAKNPAALSRIHISKGIFLERRGAKTNPMIAMRKELETLGSRFIEHDKPTELLPGVWLTGPIPRPNPEKNFPPGVEVIRGTTWVTDDIPDDQALVFNSARGLVMLTGCGHAGIINILQYARTIVRAAPFVAAIGGFHLFSAKPPTIEWTADKLKELQVAQILGAHCTGIESVYLLRQRMGLGRRDAVVATVGATFDLTSGIHTGSLAE
ncbi:MAG TPA: MBL fold metallo-hydrolase [Kofleriaceae bacterium]|nr:MBL fold metallo-hydrolase [Kofleriaceae bacterium]